MIKNNILVFLALALFGCGSGIKLKPGEVWQNGKVYKSDPRRSKINKEARDFCGIGYNVFVSREATKEKKECWYKYYNDELVKAGLREANPKYGFGNHRIGTFMLTNKEMKKIDKACWKIYDEKRDNCLLREIKKLPRKVERVDIYK